MGHTERRFLVAASIAVLLPLIAVPGAATPAGSSDAAAPPSSVSASPAAFAERFIADDRPTASRAASWQNALELLVLAGICAVAVAFYSAATARRSDTRMPVRVRRR